MNVCRPAVVALVSLAAACAHAGTTQSWSELSGRISSGSRVVVVDASGVETHGRVAARSAGGLDLDVAGITRTFTSDTVREVRRDGDPLWNGFLIGAAIGISAAALPDPSYRCPDRDVVDVACKDSQVPQRIALAAIATGAGIGIDAWRKDRSVIYRAPGQARVRIVPLVGRRTAGVVVSAGF
jgi:hypothetical protein